MRGGGGEGEGRGRGGGGGKVGFHPIALQKNMWAKFFFQSYSLSQTKITRKNTLNFVRYQCRLLMPRMVCMAAMLG